MRSSCDFFRWDIWIAKVKYEDSEEVKVRPVLIETEWKDVYCP